MANLRDQLQVCLGSAYVIERELGGGGMSRVYLAEEVRFRRRVVVKVLSPDLAAGLSIVRFEREIVLAAQLQQANIVPVITAGDVDGLPWYSMPYVDGESLRARMDQAPLSLAESVHTLRDVARALAFAHARGIVHRDIKPENVLLSSGTAVVTDFGIAKALRAARTQAPGVTLTQVGASLGSPAYMAPEQALGDEVDARADIYAWGVMAYELMSGRHPFAGRTTAQQLVAAHIAETPAPLALPHSNVTSELGQLVMRCMEKDPARRPQSASVVLESLDTNYSTIERHHGPATRRWRVRSWRGGTLAAGLVIGVAALSWAARSARERRSAVSPVAGTTVHSVAVLPFVNVGGDSAQEYFADGMTEEISGVLGKIPNLRVAGRRSAFAFKNSLLGAAEIGNALQVTLLLEGRVRRDGDFVRVTAELINAADGNQRWNGKWQGDLKDAFALQDSIAQAVAGELRLELTGQALAVSRAGRTNSPQAHDLYLRGRGHFIHSTEPDLRRAIELFQQALAVDPGFAQAQAGIASAWGIMADGYVPASEGYPRMRDAALAALRLDSLLPEAHATFGFSVLANRDYATASREMARAVALDPNSFDAALFYSNYLCLIGGRGSEGLALSDRSLTLEPLSVLASWNRELCLYSNRRWDDVIAQHRRTRELDSTFFYLEAYEAAALREKGLYAQAVAAYERAQRFQGGHPVYGLAVTHARAGRLDEGRRIMTELEQRAQRGLVSPHAMVAGFAGIGEPDKAFVWIRRAIREQSVPVIVSMRTTPELDGLRSDPRYQAIVRSLNMPPVP